MYYVNENAISLHELNTVHRRANKGRSQLVGRPLTFQAKKPSFMYFLCGNLRPKNIIFEYCLWPLLARVR